MRIGIVGSGIAGLFAAHRLRRDGHHVTIFENHSQLGIGAQSIFFDEWNCFGDVPSRMFNSLLWPKLFELYRELGIEIAPVDAAQSFSDAERKTYLRLDVAYRPQSLVPALFSGKSRRILLDARRLLAKGPEFLANLDATVRFADWLTAQNFSDEFRYGFLYPTLSSTVCTCSYSALDDYPALILLETLQKLTAAGMPIEANRPLLWRVKNGTTEVADRLGQDISEVWLETQVTDVRRQEDLVTVRFVNREGSESETSFDHVVVATQANTALGIIRDLEADEREMLQVFRYEPVHVYVHQNVSWMPRKRSDWGTFNQVPCRAGISNAVSSSDGPHGYDDSAAYCSVWMNRFHEWKAEVPPLFQTISSESLTIDSPLSEVHFQRPVVTRDSYRGWELRTMLHSAPHRRLWFVGSYASSGVPLLETGIKSVLDLPLCLARSSIGGSA